MASRAALAVCRMTRISSSPGAANLVPRRGLAGGADHGPPKVNFWEDPLSPSKWKEEHFVIVSLAGWSAIFYGGYKAFTSGKKEKREEEAIKLSQ